MTFIASKILSLVFHAEDHGKTDLGMEHHHIPYIHITFQDGCHGQKEKKKHSMNSMSRYNAQVWQTPLWGDISRECHGHGNHGHVNIIGIWLRDITGISREYLWIKGTHLHKKSSKTCAMIKSHGTFMVYGHPQESKDDGFLKSLWK